MNPLLIAKVVGALVVLAALAGAVTWAAKTIEKATGYEAAIARVTEVEREKAALAKSFADARQIDMDTAATLSTFRGELTAQSQAFRDSLNRKPLTSEVPRETNPDGTPAPCRVRDAHRYRCLHNLAITGIADSDCVL